MRKVYRWFMLFLALGNAANVVAQRGACGDQVKWTLSGETLTISGEGPMTNFTTSNRPSWFPYESVIKHVIVEDGVTTIGDYSFYSSANLEDVYLSEGLLEIGHSAFQNCTQLKSVHLPETLEIFDGGYSTYYPSQSTGYCFAGCISLRDITIPRSLRNLGYRTFQSCSNLETVNWNAISNVKEYYHYEMFSYTKVHTVNFGPEVRRVPEFLFYDVPSVTELKTTGDIEYIGQEAFHGTAWLNQFITSESVYLDKVLYEYRVPTGHPITLEIPEGVTGITEYAFKDAVYLVKITIPTTMKDIGEGAFQGCTSLGSVQWNAVAFNGNGPFFSDCAIYDFKLGDNISKIPPSLLDGCQDLTEIELPKTLKSIENTAFKRCKGLKYLEIPDSVENLSWSVFEDCDFDSLKIGTEFKGLGCSLPARKIIWNARNCEWGANKSNLRILEYLVLGDSVQVVPDNMCSGLSSLSSLSIGKSVKTIGTNAFSGTSIKEVWLPIGLESLGAYAFSGTEIRNFVIPPSIDVAKLFYCFPDSLDNVVIFSDKTFFPTAAGIMHVNNVYVKNFDIYSAEGNWKLKADNIIPLVNVDKHIPTYYYNGSSFNIADNFYPTTNLPGYNIEVLDAKTDSVLGIHDIDVTLSFKGIKNFDIIFPMQYQIIFDEATILAREDCKRLITEIDEMISRFCVYEGAWNEMNLNGDNMYSNAICQVSGNDQFTDWSVLFDSEDIDNKHYEQIGDATQFHSDYSGVDTPDGLDHYIGIKLPQGVNPSRVRFSYTTRWKGAFELHAPTDLSILASTDGENWDCVGRFKEELPTEAKTIFYSPQISLYRDYRELRFMVHKNSTNQYSANHAIFVISALNIEYYPTYSSIRDDLGSLAVADLDEIKETLVDAQKTLYSGVSIATDYYPIIERLTQYSDFLSGFIDETDSITNIAINCCDNAIYNLQGVKMSNELRTGVYISKNRKFIVR